jgi:hypothetical protein
VNSRNAQNGATIKGTDSHKKNKKPEIEESGKFDFYKRIDKSL